MNKRKEWVMKCIILCLGYFVVSLLITAATWFQMRWDSNISFATVVYQLNTLLRGTSSEIIIDFCKTVLPVVLFRVIMAVIFFTYRNNFLQF